MTILSHFSLRTSVLAAAQPLEVVCWTTTNIASRWTGWKKKWTMGIFHEDFTRFCEFCVRRSGIKVLGFLWHLKLFEEWKNNVCWCGLLLQCFEESIIGCCWITMVIPPSNDFHISTVACAVLEGVSMGLHGLWALRSHLPCWCTEVGRCCQGYRGARCHSCNDFDVWKMAKRYSVIRTPSYGHS